VTAESAQGPSSSLPSGGNGSGFWERRLHLIARAIRRYELLDNSSRKQIAMRVLVISVLVFGLAILVLLLV
jgi:hypothetical protein